MHGPMNIKFSYLVIAQSHVLIMTYKLKPQSVPSAIGCIQGVNRTKGS